MRNGCVAKRLCCKYLGGVLLVLRSLNAVTKESSVMAVILGRSTPDPGLGAPIQLLGSHTGGLFDLFGIGKTLAGQCIATKQTPTAPPTPVLATSHIRSK